MVRNKKKYADTKGWSYALFDERGLTFPEEPRNQTMACVACHDAVPEKGYVFSQLMELHPRKNEKIKSKNKAISSLLFKTIETSQLPKNILALMGKETKYIRVLEGEMRKNLFQGTLEEIRPLLSTEAENSRLPAILYNDEGTRFSLVILENPGATCTEESKFGIFMKSIYSTYDQKGQGSEKILHYCFTH